MDYMPSYPTLEWRYHDEQTRQEISNIKLHRVFHGVVDSTITQTFYSEASMLEFLNKYKYIAIPTNLDDDGKSCAFFYRSSIKFNKPNNGETQQGIEIEYKYLYISKLTDSQEIYMNYEKEAYAFRLNPPIANQFESGLMYT